MSHEWDYAGDMAHDLMEPIPDDVTDEDAAIIDDARDQLFHLLGFMTYETVPDDLSDAMVSQHTKMLVSSALRLRNVVRVKMLGIDSEPDSAVTLH